MKTITKQNLVEQGREQVVDQDHLLAKFDSLSALLIHLKPQTYPYESHKVFERIVCVSGQFELETEDGAIITIESGAMATIPPGINHRFGNTSDEVILTLYGGQS